MDPLPDKKDSELGKKKAARDAALFINNAQKDPPQTKYNLVEAPAISFPKGGGSIKSIDEKFEVNSSNGTASYNIPLPFSAARNGNAPKLSLGYNSGAGNSIFGLGWNVEVPAIHRKTDKKLPEYIDTNEQDTFIFLGSEDLVPELDEATGKRRRVTTNNITITRYRPRIENGFARIERIEESGNVYWRVRSKENVVTIFGKSDSAKLCSPAPGESNKILKWCIEYSYDDKGNCSRYFYKKENLEEVAASLHEKNRLSANAPVANTYLKNIKYGNRTGYYEGNILPEDFLFEMVFDFGEHDEERPTTKPVIINGQEKKWTARKDPFSDYKPGFEVRCYRLCRRILMFHHFTDELVLPDYLVRSIQLVYDEQLHLTYLSAVTQSGYIWNADGSLRSKRSIPPLEFSYIKPAFSRTVKNVSQEDVIHAPVGVDETQYKWTDLYSEGIPGILSEEGKGWFYKENLGDGHFSPAMLISSKPSFTGLSNGSLALQDLEADGKKYLVSASAPMQGYFELGGNNEWMPFRSFTQNPNIDLGDPNLKFVDLNGDGMADILISSEQEFVWYASQGKAGYDDERVATRSANEEKGPLLFFENHDEHSLITTADMSGDGLMDIVVVNYSSVYYYPNLGYGCFGAKVSMPMNGCFDIAASFNPRYVHFADIDGSGTTDIVYVGQTEIQVWFNQSGNRLSDPNPFLNPFPRVDGLTHISFVDMLGNGTSCLVWSSPLPQHSNAPLRYIDLMDGNKPHLLSGCKNNMGKEVKLEYKSSLQYYLQDKKNGKPWATRLPFAVHCVSKVIVEDKVSRSRFANIYNYHHGFYDAAEREFRGFALVEERDTEEYEHYVHETAASGALNVTEKNMFQAAVITRTWFHTGAYVDRQNIFHSLRKEYYHLAQSLPDMPLDPNLSAIELAECCRALKGLPLRQEIYSEEGTPEQQLHPYTITHYNYQVQRLQPKSTEKHAVFLPQEKEKLMLHLERNPLDPRITHDIVLETDKYGNVKQQASIRYGRKTPDATLLLAGDRQQQTAQHVIYTASQFTKLIDTPQALRIPVSWDAQTWELKLAPAAQFFNDGLLKSFSDAVAVGYEQTPVMEQKRKIEHATTLFLKNDLSGPVARGEMHSLALVYEHYVLAFTPQLVTALYNGKASDGLLENDGRYISMNNDGNYWIRSGITWYHPDLSANVFAMSIPPATPADTQFAKKNFYLPVAYERNNNQVTKIFHDKYKLLLNRIVDPLKNEVNADAFNYRTLTPTIIRDFNDNRSGIRQDELGNVVSTFAMGKSSEQKGDLMDMTTAETSALDKPAAIIEYTFSYHASTGKLPNKIKTLVREKHHFRENGLPGEVELNVRWQESYFYSDGHGREVLRKIQAEPGFAPDRDAQDKLVKDNNGKIIQKLTGAALRWVGNGRSVFNNKGNIVKKYEPYFDSVPDFNAEPELVDLGFSALLFYDALDRITRTENANGSFSKTLFNAWMQEIWDENDTVMDDACTWCKERINGQKGQAEKEAAERAMIHSGTPAVTHLDSMGNKFLTIEQNKWQRTGEVPGEEKTFTRTYFDIEGNALRTTVELLGTEREVMSWQYNMLGMICKQHNMDAGDRWMLLNAEAKPLRLWDSMDRTFSYEYDALNRPLQLIVINAAEEVVHQRYLYGETQLNAKNKNVLGKVFKHFDTAGVVTNELFDYKGNLLGSARKLCNDFKKVPNWKTEPEPATTAYVLETSFDALNRPTQIKQPDNSVVIPAYNEAGLLNKLDARIKGNAASTPFIVNIDYTAKGQREKIEYGNNTIIIYTHDPKTNRLTKLITVRSSDGSILQDLNYTYDAKGNITRQLDDAQKTVFYGGQKVAAVSNYIYDALYRLVESQGREHIGQTPVTQTDNWDDSWSRMKLQPNAPMQLRTYAQKYRYDQAGNITEMRHIAGAGSWTRSYEYTAQSNRLAKTILKNDVPASQDLQYAYNAHGCTLTMPHVTGNMLWNFRDELQFAEVGSAKAWYQYDGAGKRIRKVVEKPQQREERIYIGGIEIYRVFDTADQLKLERETLHIMDGQQRMAMVETKTAGNDLTPAQLIRFQYDNLQGTACLELDRFAKVITYEEYHPFGTTAYQATDASVEVPAKRYRHSSMERDEESGFNYHNSRYYIPWLARWLSPDPIGVGDNINLFLYGNNSPLVYVDLSGRDPKLTMPTKGIGGFTKQEIIDTTVTVFGEMTAAPHAKSKEEAEAITSTIMNRLQKIKDTREAFKQADAKQKTAEKKMLEAAKKSEDIGKNRTMYEKKFGKEGYKEKLKEAQDAYVTATKERGAADIARTKASSAKKEAESWVAPAKRNEKDLTLTDIGEQNGQYEGTATGKKYVKGFEKMSEPDQERNLKRWEIAKKAVEELAGDPSRVKDLVDMQSNDGGKRKLIKADKEVRLGGNDFSPTIMPEHKKKKP